jgi:hypothetical protein
MNATNTTSTAVQKNLNPWHKTQLINYLSFIRQQRNLSLKELELTFNEIIEKRLLLHPTDNTAPASTTATYNQEDIQDIFNELKLSMNATLKSEMSLHSHLNVVLLNQYFLQCQQAGIDLVGDFPEMENKLLLESAARFEEMHFDKAKETGSASVLEKIQKPNYIHLIQYELGIFELSCSIRTQG